MNRSRVLRSRDRRDWWEVLRCCCAYDSYHRPEYHALAETNGEGVAHLFTYEDGPYVIAAPLLLRPVDQVSGASFLGASYQDATSVYGYAGPIASHADLPADVVVGFQQSLIEALRERHVVCVFSRLHPLMHQPPVLAGLGECRPGQETVSLDLTLPESAQLQLYRRNHTDGIRRLRKAGVTCVHDEAGCWLHDFIDIYHATMRRRGAPDSYYYPAEYYQGLLSDNGGMGHLFVCRQHERTICATIILECQGFVQYHLGGTHEEYGKLAPMKLLIDTVRRWACERHNRVFHLGGGTTAEPDDSLLHFKKGFSGRRHVFHTWRWVLLPDIYERLCAARATLEGDCLSSCEDYFPAYRKNSDPLQRAMPTAVLTAEDYVRS